MPRYIINEAGEKVKVSGTNYIPPCLAKTAKRNSDKVKAVPVIETQTEYNEATYESNAEDDHPLP